MKNVIPYGKQNICQKDIDAVVDVLKSDFLTQGPKVPLFEQGVADYCSVKYAVAVNSATSALHIACLALGITTGDIVWTSPISFVASSNCALYCGASIDFVDIDISTGNMSVEALTEKLHQAEQENKLPKVIIPVHLAGQSCQMREIKQLADQYQIKIIEDASHAIGGKYLDRPIGNCQYSDITVFSFHPVKIITTAEGGVALTNNTAIAEKLNLYRSHGVTSSPELMTTESHGSWYYQQIALGFNYRMTELQAVLGINQLNKLNGFVNQRNSLATKYNAAFADTQLTLLTPKRNCYSSYHLYIVLLPAEASSKRKAILETLRQEGIFAHVHYIPIHTQPYYQQLGFNAGDFPIAENYYQRAISLPLHPALTDDEQAFIIEKVKQLL